MSRRVRPKVDRAGTPGAYRHVAETVEKETRLWLRYHPNSSAAESPYRRAAADLGAGRAVNVPIWMLPEAVAAAQVRSERRLPVARLVAYKQTRAIVRPDDSVIFTDSDDLRLWLEEMDI
ncbi:MAG: hypothetical protein AB1925_15665 [Actinomycetota bacterium]